MRDFLPVVAFLATVAAVLLAFWVGGVLDGRCQATCASLDAAHESNDGNACWCEGMEQPVRALGSK